MRTNRVDVRPGSARDEPSWRRLWSGYLEFYEQELPEAVTAATWSRLHDPDVPMGLLVATRDGEVVGFANYVVHPSTWAETESCYLEDLFVAPEARGQGAGAALIEALLALARKRGWSQVFWHTRGGNADARRVYDRFAHADDFVRYVIELKSG